MGAGGLIEIKRRLKSVQNTRKITNAMGLVSTSKLRKCRNALKDSEEYFNVSRKNIESLANASKELDGNIYFNGNKSDKKLYIVVTADSGLCAGYNGNTVAYLESVSQDFKDKVNVIAVGRKGLSYLRKAKLNTIAEYVDIAEIPTEKDVKVIYQKALRLFMDEEVSEVNVVYTKFESPVRQTVTIEKLLPLDNIEGNGKEPTVEPSLEIVLKNSVDAYLKGELRRLMLSSRCSEECARMNAMNGATSNANDILDALNLKYNRIRQAMITQEISEIVGGAAAQK